MTLAMRSRNDDDKKLYYFQIDMVALEKKTINSFIYCSHCLSFLFSLHFGGVLMVCNFMALKMPIQTKFYELINCCKTDVTEQTKEKVN